MKKHYVPHIADPDAIREAIQSRLDILTRTFDKYGRIRVEISVPDDNAYKDCQRINQTACATITLKSECDPAQTAEIRVPFPRHGVFVIQNGSAESDEPDRARLQIWHPSLESRPGIYFTGETTSPIHGEPADADDSQYTTETMEGSVDTDDQDDIREKTRKEQKPKFSLHVVALNRARFVAKSPKPTGTDKSKSTKSGASECWMIPSAQILQQIQSFRSEVGEKLVDVKKFLEDPSSCILDKKGYKRFQNLLQVAIDQLSSHFQESDFSDQNHLDNQILYTYSVFLVDRLSMALARRLKKTQLFTKQDQLSIEAELLRALRPQNRQIYSRPWLAPFNPQNAVDAISELTTLERYSWLNKKVDNLPHECRQIHPSYKGLICPVETPESEKIGITMHLAAGVQATVDGRLIQTIPKQTQGYAASHIPFYQHNDGARSMMGAKNYVQAIPVKAAEPPLITTGDEHSVREALKDLLDSGLAGKQSPAFFHPGKDLLVAYMPWFGWNYEDAIVACDTLSDDLSVIKERRFSAFVPPGYEPETCFSGTSVKIREDSSGQYGGNAVARFLSRSGESFDVDLNVSYAQRDRIICKHYSEPPSPFTSGLLVWHVSICYPLLAGDKLMGRYGNKGIVSGLFRPDDMPRLPEDKRLGSLSGRSVDLVLNPHGVISRMNLGQLIETQIGLFRKLGVLPDSADSNGAAFKRFNPKLLQKAIDTTNAGIKPPLLDPAGKMYLTLPNNKRTKTPVVVGMQYILRLQHIPSEKAYSRKTGERFDLVTGQPHRGKAKQGGQRIGEMEMWALSASQARHVLADSLTDRTPEKEYPEIKDDECQAFHATKAYLQAIGIRLYRNDEGAYCVEWLNDTHISTTGKPLISRKIDVSAIKARFHCLKTDCQEPMTECMVATEKRQRSDLSLLCVRDVLFHHKLVPLMEAPHPPQIPKGKRLVMKVDCLNDEGKLVKIAFSVDRRAQKTVTMTFAVDTVSYSAFVQSQKDEFNLNTLLDLTITCNKHKTGSPLEPFDYEKVPTPHPPKGLSDSEYLGLDDWGYICLPEPIQFLKGKDPENLPPKLSYIPVLPMRYRSASHRRNQDYIADQLENGYQKVLNSAWEWATCWGSKEQNGKRKKNTVLAVKNLRKELYNKILDPKNGFLRHSVVGRQIDISGRYVIAPDPDLAWDECALSLDAMIKLFGDLLSDWVNIIEFPNQASDIKQALSRYPEQINGKTTALLSEFIQKFVEIHSPIVLVCRQPTLHRYNIKALRVKAPENNANNSKKSGTSKPTYANRFDEIFHESDEDADEQEDDACIDSVLRINPLICSSMGADFDGDCVSVYLLATGNDAEREADKRNLDEVQSKKLKRAFRQDLESMLPTAEGNLISDADPNSPVAGFSQDIVLGTYLISLDPKARREFIKEIAFPRCKQCRQLLSDPKVGHWDKLVGQKFMVHLCSQHTTFASARIQNWTKRAFDFVSLMGVSFGILDCLACKVSAKYVIAKTNRIDLNDKLQNKVLDQLCKKFLSETPKFKEPGFAIAAMACSGARGEEQVRQILAARGYLPPKEHKHILHKDSWVFRRSLLDGMDAEAAFWTAMNARSSMTDKKLLTAVAGALLRDMVWICWEWRVKAGDCGLREKSRLPHECLWVSRDGDSSTFVCAECYGKISGVTPPDGYPAGIIAAQSIGERTSQRCMQSFHTGTTAVDIENVKSMLAGIDKESFQSLNINRQEIPAFESIHDRHFSMLWLAVTRLCPRGRVKISTVVVEKQKNNLFAALVRKNVPLAYLRYHAEQSFATPVQDDLERTVVGYKRRPGTIASPTRKKLAPSFQLAAENTLTVQENPLTRNMVCNNSISRDSRVQHRFWLTLMAAWLTEEEHDFLRNPSIDNFSRTAAEKDPPIVTLYGLTGIVIDYAKSKGLWNQNDKSYPTAYDLKQIVVRWQDWAFQLDSLFRPQAKAQWIRRRLIMEGHDKAAIEALADSLADTDRLDNILQQDNTGKQVLAGAFRKYFKLSQGCRLTRSSFIDQFRNHNSARWQALRDSFRRAFGPSESS